MRLRSAARLQRRLEFVDAGPERGRRGIDLREREPGRDVLGAVPVEGLDGDQQPSLGMSAVTREHEVVVQKGIVALYDVRRPRSFSRALCR